MTSNVKKYEIVVLEQNTRYTGSPCAQCNAVVRKLTTAKKSFQLDELQDDDGNISPENQMLLDLAKDRGFSSAPIVALYHEDHVIDIFGGYNPARLKEFMEYV